MTENKISIEKLKNLQWKIMQDVSASALIPLMRIGDELGLFIVLGKQGPCTESEFSNFAKIDQRYAKEWLLAMCAAGYISHSDEVSKFYMSEEQKAVFSFEESSAFMLGAFDILSGNIHNIEKVKKDDLVLCLLILLLVYRTLNQTLKDYQLYKLHLIIVFSLLDRLR